MRVIRDNRFLRKVCPRCKSVLAIFCKDINVSEFCHHSYPQWATCSVCGESIPIELSEIPDDWRWILFKDFD